MVEKIEQLKDLIPKVYVCPKCKGNLEVLTTSKIRCQKCSQSYPIIEDIPIFAPHLIDEFYERRIWLTEFELSTKAPLKEKVIMWILYQFNLSMRRRFFLKRMLKGKKGLILDIGCGAGKQLYHQVGPVVGIDICLNGLKKAKKVYSSVAQADALNLPFRNELFDFIVSTDLIEHIPSPQKDILFAEMFRVLRPGGKMIHEIETLSNNLLYRKALSDMDLFFKYFVTEVSGHFGLETVEEILDRFYRFGAKKMHVEIIYDLFWPLSDFNRVFGKEYREKYPSIFYLTKLSEIVCTNRSLKNFIETFLGIIAKAYEKFRNIKNAKDIGVYLEK